MLNPTLHAKLAQVLGRVRVANRGKWRIVRRHADEVRRAGVPALAVPLRADRDPSDRGREELRGLLDAHARAQGLVLDWFRCPWALRPRRSVGTALETSP